MADTDTNLTPGWAALDRALRQRYGDQTPRHYGTLIKYRAGGPDPLDGISAYFNRAPTPHWHFVSYGLTELFTKESPNPKVSGFGFELTFRLAVAREEKEPPLWPLGLMQHLARYVYSTGRYFEPGHFFSLEEPLAPGADAFTTVAFAREPELPVVSGPFGAFEFLQLVPLLEDELRAARSWNTLGVLEVMSKRDPLLIFRPERRSLLTDSDARAAIAAGRAKDGSATGALSIDGVGWQRSPWGPGVELTLSQAALEQLPQVLLGRIKFGRKLELTAPGAKTPPIVFEAAEDPKVEPTSTGLSIRLTAELAERVARDLEKAKGELKWPELPGLTVQAAAPKRT